MSANGRPEGELHRSVQREGAYELVIAAKG